MYIHITYFSLIPPFIFQAIIRWLVSPAGDIFGQQQLEIDKSPVVSRYKLASLTPAKQSA